MLYLHSEYGTILLASMEAPTVLSRGCLADAIVHKLAFLAI